MLEPWNDLAEAEVFISTANGIALLGVRCANCGRIDFPPTPFCRDCLSDEVQVEVIPSAGTLYAFTTVHTTDPAYTVGYIDLPIGLRVFGHLTRDAAIGDQVEIVSTELPVTFARIGGAR